MKIIFELHFLLIYVNNYFILFTIYLFTLVCYAQYNKSRNDS